MAIATFLRQFRSALLLAVGTLLVACPVVAQDNIDNLDAASMSAMERGANALDNEDYEAAQEAFKEAIATAPNDARGYIGLAQALAGLEQYQEALAQFTQAETFSSGADSTMKEMRAETQFQRGKMYMDWNNQFIGTALSDLQAAYDFNPSDLRYVFQLGKAYAIASPFNPGAGAQAEPLLTQYIEEYPNDAEAHRLRGTAYASMNKVDDAFADLDRAIELDPDDYQNYFASATVRMTQEEFAKSAELFEKAIEKYKPKDEDDDAPFAQGYLTLAAVYEEMGKASDDPEVQKEGYAKSIETCDNLLALLPDDNTSAQARAGALFRKGVGHRLLEQFGPAVRALTEAIDLNPEAGEYYFRRAICFAEMGEEGLAMRDLQDAQALLFGDARPYLWEGITNAQQGNYRDAIRAYNTAISFSNRYVDPYLNRAHAYFQLGEYQAAIDSFNECIRLQPTAPEYYYKRGLCYQNLGDPDRAIKSYINAIEVNDSYLPAYDVLIPLLEQQGRSELAEQYRAKRAEIEPPQEAANSRVPKFGIAETRSTDVSRLGPAFSELSAGNQQVTRPIILACYAQPVYVVLFPNECLAAAPITVPCRSR